MSQPTVSRRGFLRTTLGTAAAGVVVPYFVTGQRVLADEAKATAKNDRLHVGLIGCGGKGTHDGSMALPMADLLAVCDVDAHRVAEAKSTIGQGKVQAYEDYRKVLDRKDIDAVIIGTPDHWHSKIAIEAMLSGKDVYCEKPLTLTIDEGKLICDTVTRTNRVFQVGTQQRSEYNGMFIQAAALARSGRLGKIKTITAAIGDGPTCKALPKVNVPPSLNWDMWLGQAPLAEYILGTKKDVGAAKDAKLLPPSRCHYHFRWWLEYSGGKLTDWGAHHVDIAHWALDATETGPVSVAGTGSFPVPMKDGYPTVNNRYNAATSFRISAKFADGAELIIVDEDPNFENGIRIEGEKETVFVSRTLLAGKPVEELKSNPLPSELISKLLKGQQPGNHMENFLTCVKTRQQPISDVFSHHRSLTTCHLANISMRLKRPLKWDPVAQQIVGDDEANGWLKRPQRAGYEIKV